MAWVFPHANPPVKFKTYRSLSTQIITCFFAKSGHVATIPLEDGEMVTADWCVNHCLSEVFQAWCKWRSWTGVRGLLLCHDNSSICSSCNSEISSHQWSSAGHPPTILTWLSPLWLALVPFLQGAVEGKAVSKRQRCPSFFRGVSFWIYPSHPVIGCHRQLVWEVSRL